MKFPGTYLDVAASHGGNIRAYFIEFDKPTAKILKSGGEDFPDAFQGPLMADMRDHETGLIHRVEYKWIHIEAYDDPVTGDPRYCLNDYMYAWHWCGCHRWPHDVPKKSRDECPDERFVVEKLWYPELPDIVLMYETDARMRSTKGK